MGNRDDSEKIFLFFNENLCCDPQLELSQHDDSNEGSQPIFHVKIWKLLQ